VVARDGATLAGLLPLYPTPVEEIEADRVTALFTDLAPDRVAGTVLLIGSDVEAPNVLTAASPRIARALLRTAWTWARRERTGLVCVPNLDDAQYGDTLASIPVSPSLFGRRDEAYFDVSYRSFQEYLGALPQRQRYKVRRYRRALRESGVVIRSVPAAAAVDDVLPLLAQCERKYGWRDSTRWLRTHLTTTAMAMGHSGRTLLASEGGRVIAFVTVWDVGPYWRVRAWGCDYGAAAVRAAFLYFNLTLFEPLERAITAGVSRIELGSGSLAAKLERGAATRGLRSLGWNGSDLGTG
jgi:hypothetical protein